MIGDTRKTESPGTSSYPSFSPSTTSKQGSMLFPELDSDIFNNVI